MAHNVQINDLIQSPPRIEPSNEMTWQDDMVTAHAPHWKGAESYGHNYTSYCPAELSLELAVHGKHTAASSNLAVTWTCGDPEIELIADVRTGSNVGLGAKEGSDLMQVSPVEQITHTLLFQTSAEHLVCGR